MKRAIKLTFFNIAFVIIAILCFSKRGIGLSFDLSNGAFLFALTVGLSIIGIAIFFYGNYRILTKIEKVNLKIDKLTSIDECILALQKCKKTDPSFLSEISKAIEQLHTLKRRKESLTLLLEQNDVSESFNYLNQTADKANFFVFSNIKRIINRLIVFDNEEYKKNSTSYDIESHRIYIRGILNDNKSILDEYDSFLLAVSNIGDTTQTNIEEIKDMTAALNHVLKGKNFESLERKYSETQNFKEDM